VASTSATRDNAEVSEAPEAPARQAHAETSSTVGIRVEHDRLYGPLLIATAVVGVTIAAIAVIAFSRLVGTGTARDWIPIYQDVLKTSFGALAVGGLGGLAKLVYFSNKSTASQAHNEGCCIAAA
jgi:hypothetical protein